MLGQSSGQQENTSPGKDEVARVQCSQGSPHASARPKTDGPEAGKRAARMTNNTENTANHADTLKHNYGPLGSISERCEGFVTVFRAAQDTGTTGPIS